MNFGFNSNVRVGEATYHVQTEDRGPSHPFLDTVVYLAGRVVHKRSTSYDKFATTIKSEDLAKKLHERLSQQHREVIAELEAGTLLNRPKEKPAEIPKSLAEEEGLDLRLLNPKTWIAAGNVVFEIELLDRESKQRIAEADVQVCLELEKRRIPCAEMRTDDEGRAVLKFPMPKNLTEGASLVIRAMDGSRHGELRFRLKSKTTENSPAPASR
jgi:hypothetical protein